MLASSSGSSPAGQQSLRMRFGVYFYSEPDSPLARQGDVPAVEQKDLK